MPQVRRGGSQRWATRTAAATGDYQAGVQAPRRSWQAATVAAAPAHKAAMAEALAQDRFAKGVQRVGDAKWQNAATGKGAERFGPGAAAGVQDYEQAVAPYLQVIESTQLPARGAKGDPRNYERVKVLGMALRKKKTGSIGLGLVVLLAVVSVFVGVLFQSRHWRGAAPQTPRNVAGMLIDGKAEAKAGLLKQFGLALALLAPFGLMGAALDVVTASVTAAAAGGAAMAAVTGDSLAVRNTSLEQTPVMIQLWAKSQTSGFAQLTHPSGHDQVRDIRWRHVAATPLPLLCPGYGEPMEPQELIGLSLGAGAVAGDIELVHMLVYYPSLPGIDARLIDLNQLDSRFVEYVTIEDTTTATAGATYSGARALNAASDLLVANTEFAVIGAHLGALCGALTIRGVDTGNLRVAIPGMSARPDVTANWFPWLTQEFGLPLIPVINSANKAGIFIENVQDENLVAVPFSLLLARLSS